MKKTLSLILISLLFLVGCSSGNETQEVEKNPNSLFPADIPVHPESKVTSSTDKEILTSEVYTINDNAANVKTWYSQNLKEPWELELTWFKYEDGMQLKMQTEDFDPSPNARKGREVIVTVYELNEAQSRVVVLHTHYNN